MHSPLDSNDYILLAEDNPADAQLVREALEDRAVKCHLHVLSDGDQAVRFIERIDRESALNCPKLVIVDLYLPKQDGEEIIKSLRASERCGQTAVVVMTSSLSPQDRARATRHAALHYFEKPASLEQFLILGDVVKGIIDRQSNHQ